MVRTLLIKLIDSFRYTIRTSDVVWKQVRRENYGFTVIEILAALVILGVVIGIVVPKVSGTIRASKEMACEVNLQMIEKAIERYGMDHVTSTGDPDYSGISWDALIPEYFEVGNTVYDDQQGCYCPACPVTGGPYTLNTEQDPPTVICSSCEGQ